MRYLTKGQKKAVNALKVATMLKQMKKLSARVFKDAACQTEAVEEEVRCPNAVRTRDFGCQADVPPERVCLSNISSSVLNTKAAKGKKNDAEKCWK